MATYNLTAEDAGRFWSYVDKTPGQGPQGQCWAYVGGRFPKGYGSFWLNGRNVGAHRVAWVLREGRQVPKGKLVCHECDWEPCVRHVFLDTAKGNVHDMLRKGRGYHGEEHHSVKLTEAKVRRIRTSTESHRTLGARYGVTHVLVGKIKRREVWRWLE